MSLWELFAYPSFLALSRARSDATCFGSSTVDSHDEQPYSAFTAAITTAAISATATTARFKPADPIIIWKYLERSRVRNTFSARQHYQCGSVDLYVHMGMIFFRGLIRSFSPLYTINIILPAGVGAPQSATVTSNASTAAAAASSSAASVMSAMPSGIILPSGNIFPDMPLAPAGTRRSFA